MPQIVLETMSMRTYPNSGYIVKLEELEKLASPQQLTELQAAVAESDAEVVTDVAQDILCRNALSDLEVGCFQADDEQAAELELGAWYAVFPESCLFVKVDTAAGAGLKIRGVVPKLKEWTTFG